MTLGSVAAVSLAMFAWSCGETSITEVIGPDVVRCQTTVSSPPSTFPPGGSRATVNVVAERECTWTASSEASWIQVSPTSGQGEAALVITVTENSETRARSSAVLVNSHRVAIAQEAAPCRFQLNNSGARLSQEGGQVTVRVTTTSGCEWRVSNPVGWIQVLRDSGTGAGTTELQVSRNTGNARSAQLSIGGQPFLLQQDGRSGNPSPTPPPGPGPTDPPDAPGPPNPPNPDPPPPPPPPSPTCVYAIDPDSRTFDAKGGDGSVKITTADGCTWSASSSQGWIEMTSGTSGSGTGTVKYRVSSNSSTSERGGTVSVAGRSHSVRQEGSEGDKIELEGRARSVSGSCPSMSFQVEGRSVFTTGETNFKDRCSRLKDGAEVEVDGRVQSDGRVWARKIEIDDDDDDDN